MFSIRQNFTQRSSRLPKKSQLLTMDTAYLGQPFVRVVGKNQNTLGLDVSYNAQPFVAAYNNRLTGLERSVANHMEVDKWLANVYWNAGGANSTTIAALNTFCNAIDNAGIRSKFYRLNLFCGNNLQACCVPLYTSTSYYDQSLGLAVDMNNGFVSGDYNETGSNGGLLGDGTSKHLRTGLRPDKLPSGFEYNCHLSAYRKTAGNTQALMGSYYYDTTITANRHSYEIAQNTIILNATGGPTIPTISGYPAFQLGIRSSSSYSIAYTNSTAGTPYTASITAFATNVPFIIFGRNLITGSPPSDGGQSAFGTYNSTFLTTSLLAGYSIGSSLSSSEAIAFYNAIQAFQTSLGRNV